MPVCLNEINERKYQAFNNRRLVSPRSYRRKMLPGIQKVKFKNA